MTGGTSHTFVHVNAVIEIDKVRQVINTLPLDRLACPPAFPNRLQIRTVSPDLGMAIHTSLGRRDSSKCEFFYTGVAVAAVDSVIAHVVLVTELNWLLAREKGLGVIRRSVEFKQHPDQNGGEKDSAENRRLGNEVGASIKDLPHRFLRAIENWKQGAANAST
jgi:hypothetical protein